MNFVASTDERFFSSSPNEFAPYAIEDTRSSSADFQYITICGQSVKQQSDLLFANLLASSLPNCSAIAADLLCSFRFEDKLWPVLVDFYLRHVNSENPLLPCWMLQQLWTLFQAVKEECKYNTGLVRNHRQLRFLLSQTLFVLCKSPSKPKCQGFQFTRGLFRGLSTTPASKDAPAAAPSQLVVESLCLSDRERKKRKREEEKSMAASLQKTQSTLVDPANKATFYLQLVSQNIRAPSTVFVETFLQSFQLESDGYLAPFSLFLNEFLFSLQSADTRRTLFLQYWFHCMIELHAKKVVKNKDFKHKIKKNDEFSSLFQYLFRCMGTAKPSLSYKKEPQDAHIVWVAWAAILQYLEIQAAQRPECEAHQRFLFCAQQLLVLFYIQFPVPVSSMYLYMGMLFDLLANQDRVRLLKTLAEFCECFHQTIPPFFVMSLSPYQIVNRCKEKLTK